jgi:hypothetical protein
MNNAAPEGQPSFPDGNSRAVFHDRLGLGIACLILIVGAALLGPQYDSRINPDATAYFSLAHKWTQGDWFNGISGHWSPLFIWLIAFGLKLGLSNLMSVNIIDIMAGCILLWAANRLARQSNLSLISRSILLASISLYVLYFTFSAITPDVLMAALLTTYLALSAQASQSLANLCMTGAVAGLAYLAKPIALDFVLAHYLITNLVIHRRAGALSRIRIVIPVMFLVAAPWVACLWVKYHNVTLGTAGNNLLREMAPAFRPTGVVNVGLAAPPNPTAPNYWEQPDQLNLPEWSPLDQKHRRYFLGYVGENAIVLILFLSLMSILAIPILFYATFRWWRGSTSALANSLLIASLILSPVYCLFVVSDRYLLPVVIWLMLLAALLIPPTSRTSLAMILVCLSFVPYAVLGLAGERHQGNEERQIAHTLSKQLGLNGNVASLGDWRRSLYVCYFGGLPYYGVPAAGSSSEVLQELRRSRIRYVLVWRNDTVQPNLLDGMRLVSDSRVPPELKVYELPIPAASAKTILEAGEIR